MGLCSGSRHLGRKCSKTAEKQAWAIRYNATDGGVNGVLDLRRDGLVLDPSMANMELAN